jgi:hypothetical protein
VRHLKGLPHVDPDRVGIWGWSGGGTNTILPSSCATAGRSSGKLSASLNVGIIALIPFI